MSGASAIEEPIELVLTRDVEKALGKHPGKWAAVTRTQVLAVGDSAEDVLRGAAKLGNKEPILLRVPDTANTIYLF
jgi:hypothetical protein